MRAWSPVAHEDRFPQNGNIDLDDPILLAGLFFVFWLVLYNTD